MKRPATFFVIPRGAIVCQRIKLCLSCRMAGFGVSLVGLDIAACRLWRD